MGEGVIVGFTGGLLADGVTAMVVKELCRNYCLRLSMVSELLRRCLWHEIRARAKMGSRVRTMILGGGGPTMADLKRWDVSHKVKNWADSI